MIGKPKSCPCGALTYTDDGRRRCRCPECNQKAVYRPTEDPSWHHEHVDQGRIAHCKRKGCRETWPVLCHNGRRRYCDTCSRAVRRDRDRADKARRRKQVKRNTEVYQARFSAIVARAAEAGPVPGLDEDEEYAMDEQARVDEIARLEQALDFSVSVNDAHGVRIARERLNALSSSRVY
jgi:hypothetical protein